MPGRHPEDPFVTLLGWLVARAGGVRRLAEHSGIGERTIEQWQAGAYPTRRRSSALRILDGWALANVQDYPRLAGGKTLVELSEAARAGSQLVGGPVAASDQADTLATAISPLAINPAPTSPPTPSNPADAKDLKPVAILGDSSSQLHVPVPDNTPELSPDALPGQRRRRHTKCGTTARTVTLLSAGIVAAAGVILLRPDPTVTVTGRVKCVGGALVQGVWVDALSDEDNSGMATVGRVDSAGADYTWTGLLQHSYAVHVGCGGSPEDWKVIGYSAFTSSNPATFFCDDLARSGELPPHHVTCAEIATG